MAQGHIGTIIYKERERLSINDLWDRIRALEEYLGIEFTYFTNELSGEETKNYKKKSKLGGWYRSPRTFTLVGYGDNKYIRPISRTYPPISRVLGEEIMKLSRGNCPYCDAEAGYSTTWGMSLKAEAELKQQHDKGHPEQNYLQTRPIYCPNCGVKLWRN